MTEQKGPDIGQHDGASRAATLVGKPPVAPGAGVGSFTFLSVPSDVPAIHGRSPISGPVIEAEGIELGGGALLFLDDTGHITDLEMYANGDEFSESITAFELTPWDESNTGLHGTG